MSPVLGSNAATQLHKPPEPAMTMESLSANGMRQAARVSFFISARIFSSRADESPVS
jgi:hypothetical protein